MISSIGPSVRLSIACSGLGPAVWLVAHPLLAALHESGVGPSQTSRDVRFWAAVGGQADIKHASPGFLIYDYTIARPSPVSLAVAVENGTAKAQVIDIAVHRTLAAAKASLAAAGPAREGLQEFRDRVDVAEIAIWLSAVLDDGQVFKLNTILRNAPSDMTLDALADALDAI
jgi:hypothetical protein